jgi:pyruvate dehydrogenase (quinone)
MPTTADILVERLIDWGVDVAFGIPGDGIDGVFEALRTHRDHIRFIQVRHEETAAFMACAYAKFTGRPAACVATSGPGGIHLTNGLYDAALDNQPVVAITGQTAHDLIGTYDQQDVDFQRLFADVAVYNQRINSPTHAAPVIDQAMRMALTKRGVVNLTIPRDVQTEDISEARRSKRNVEGHSRPSLPGYCALPTQDALRAAATVLNEGRRVAILAGRGALNAGSELEQVAELVGGPIIKALLGKAVVPDESPYTTGGIGLLGTTPTQRAIDNCDTLFIVGSSFPYVEYYPTPGQARCVQLDLDPARIGLRYPVDVPLVGNSRDVLQALLPMIRPKADRSFLEEAQRNMADWWRLLDTRATSRAMPMKPQVPAHELNGLLQDDAIVVTDSGTIASWAARQIRIRRGQMFSVSGSLATMACGLPYALGAQVAYPGRQVVALVGDGDFTMLMGDLATAVKYQLPVKILIFKNDSLAQIRWEQMIFDGFPEYGTELHPIDFAKFAEAVGAGGYTIERPQEAGSILAEALAYPGPAVIQAVVDVNEPPMPPKLTYDQVAHFAQALAKGQPERLDILRTIVAGRVRELI